MLTRRHLLATGVTLPFAMRSFAEPASPAWIILGTDTGEGIYRASWNPASGEIGKPELHARCDRPVYFAHHPHRPLLYVNNELGDGKALLSSFHTSHDSLQAAQQLPCDDGPCFVSCDTSNVYVANYAAGSFETWRLGTDGTLLTPPQAFRAPKFTHPGTVADRQDNPHFHCAILSPDGSHILVCDLGSDKIHIFAKLSSALSSPRSFHTRPGSGPRHVAFHPNGRWLYVIYELDCTIQRFDWHNGTLTAHEDAITQLLAPGTTLTGNTGCELLISPDGRFAYASTRGVDELNTYTIHPQTGALTLQQRLPIGGKVPRLIAFDPTRRWLVSCNQGAPGNVTVFAHDPATGRVDPTPKSFAAPTPMCVAWL